jgi:glycosyltransferase involved in cell wall biosynthesis
MRPVVAMPGDGTSALAGRDALGIAARPPLDRSLLSIVVPLYNESEVMEPLWTRLDAVIAQLKFAAVEVLLIDDGSQDDTPLLIRRLAARDPRFRGVFLSRNFGHQAAVSTGLRLARGSVVAIIDGDLQDPPEALAGMTDALEHAEIAYGIRTQRKESVPKRAAYHAFYRMLRRVSSIDIPLDAGDFCCMRRVVVDAMSLLPERRRFVRGLRAWVGYSQVGVPYEREARFAGVTKYTLAKLVRLSYDGVFSFSGLPIRLMQLLGFMVSGSALLIAFVYFVLYLIEREAFPIGFATLVISIWLIGGVQLLFMGLVGEYVYRTFEETRARPTAIVASVTEPLPTARASATEPAPPRSANGA